MKDVLIILVCVVVVIAIIAIKMFREHTILGKRAVNIRHKQNLSEKYNPNVIRGKDGRYKSVQSPHLKKA